MRILIADDDRTIRNILELWLRKLGHSCFVATDGMSAVDVFRRSRPDCVLMDLQMPKMDGAEATVCIRALERATGGKRSYIIAITGSMVLCDVRRCIECGADEYLPKPLRLAQYKEVLNRAATSIASDHESSAHANGIESVNEGERRRGANK